MATNETPDLESIQQALNKSDPQAVNPSNAGGSDPTLGEVQEKFSAITDSIDQFSGPDNELSLPEVQEKLAGALDPADTLVELPLNQWLMRYQSSLPLLKQVIEQKIAKLPKPNEGLQAVVSDLRADRRASASAVLNLLFYVLTVYNPGEDKVRSELLHGLLMALSTRLDDKTIHSGEEARADYDQFNITIISREVDLEDSSIFPEIEQQILRSQQNSTDISSAPLHKPTGLLLYLNPDPQAPISTKEESTLQYMCSETKPFVIALTAK